MKLKVVQHKLVIWLEDVSCEALVEYVCSPFKPVLCVAISLPEIIFSGNIDFYCWVSGASLDMSIAGQT